MSRGRVRSRESQSRSRDLPRGVARPAVAGPGTLGEFSQIKPVSTGLGNEALSRELKRLIVSTLKRASEHGSTRIFGNQSPCYLARKRESADHQRRNRTALA